MERGNIPLWAFASAVHHIACVCVASGLVTLPVYKQWTVSEIQVRLIKSVALTDCSQCETNSISWRRYWSELSDGEKANGWWEKRRLVYLCSLFHSFLFLCREHDDMIIMAGTWKMQPKDRGRTQLKKKKKMFPGIATREDSERKRGNWWMDLGKEMFLPLCSIISHESAGLYFFLMI